jgi:hypothetical protein
MNTASESTCIIPMVCAKCHKPITGSSMTLSGGGEYYHQECAPGMSFSFAVPPEKIDYDRIRQIVREEIAAAKSMRRGDNG